MVFEDLQYSEGRGTFLPRIGIWGEVVLMEKAAAVLILEFRAPSQASFHPDGVANEPS